LPDLCATDLEGENGKRRGIGKQPPKLPKCPPQKRNRIKGGGEGTVAELAGSTGKPGRGTREKWGD